MFQNPANYLANPRETAPCPFVVKWDNFGRILLVRGPAYKLFRLPVGAVHPEHGWTITAFSPDWSHISEELVWPCVTMERARQSGHEIEGTVRIRGRRYSAFTGGNKIIVRMR
jgi:hypothetical protein